MHPQPQPEPEQELPQAGEAREDGALRAELERLRAAQATAAEEMRAEMRAKEAVLQQMALDINRLAARLPQQTAVDDVEAPADSQGEPQPPEDSQPSTEKAEQEPWGWRGVVALVGSTGGALVYFANGSPALAQPVERDLECELDPDCGETSFDDLEQVCGVRACASVCVCACRTFPSPTLFLIQK